MSEHEVKRTFPATVAVTFLLIQVWFMAGCSSSGDAQTTSPAVNSKPDARVKLFDPSLSFIPPAGFKALDVKQMKVKLADNDHPRNIFADGGQTGYVMVDYLDDLEMAPADLARAKGFTERTQRELAPWITSEMIDMNGRQWWHFESEDPDPSDFEALVAPVDPDDAKTSPTPKKERMHYDAYSTVFKNRLLRFTFESSIANYPRLKDAFAQSLRSIQVKDQR